MHKPKRIQIEHGGRAGTFYASVEIQELDPVTPPHRLRPFRITLWNDGLEARADLGLDHLRGLAEWIDQALRAHEGED
ncbi:hypothetical protein HW532_15880 [Kaustia mangrovi]|uniref:Uncharacterized protein n=1 Tax=Kaustia mangrovi TaxID=2593653 RepID=A0A7S8HCV7_9HYPH|nr:hypothetical protein [Kaustia mangrovi]QPC44041.1 hypothetical protein HW532_15880 [Kaustia mangrovi]